MPMKHVDRFRWDLQGYLRIPHVLGRAELKFMNEAIDRNIETARDDRRVGRGALDGEKERKILGGVLHWEKPLCDPFRALLADKRLVPYLNDILGFGWRLDQEPFLIITDTGAEGAIMHGSGRFAPGAFFYDCTNGQMRAGMIVVEYVLTDHGPGDGGFACIPGSHKSDVSPPEGVITGEVERDLIVQPVAEAGDVIIFNEATLHGTAPWVAEHQRRALLYRYSPAYLTAGGGLASYVLPPWTEDLDEMHKSVLRPPSMFAAHASWTTAPWSRTHWTRWTDPRCGVVDPRRAAWRTGGTSPRGNCWLCPPVRVGALCAGRRRPGFARRTCRRVRT